MLRDRFIAKIGGGCRFEFQLLTQELFQPDGLVRLFVAVFDDDRRVEGSIPRAGVRFRRGFRPRTAMDFQHETVPKKDLTSAGFRSTIPYRL